MLDRPFFVLCAHGMFSRYDCGGYHGLKGLPGYNGRNGKDAPHVEVWVDVAFSGVRIKASYSPVADATPVVTCDLTARCSMYERFPSFT